MSYAKEQLTTEFVSLQSPNTTDLVGYHEPQTSALLLGYCSGQWMHSVWLVCACGCVCVRVLTPGSWRAHCKLSVQPALKMQSMQHSLLDGVIFTQQQFAKSECKATVQIRSCIDSCPAVWERSRGWEKMDSKFIHLMRIICRPNCFNCRYNKVAVSVQANCAIKCNTA